MRFTLSALAVPVLLLLVDYLAFTVAGEITPLAPAAVVWLAVLVWVLPLYWAARVFRRAWRDGARRGHGALAARIR